MAITKKKIDTKETADLTSDETGSDEAIVCGVIMPIAATQSHSESHWRDVQGLLHRCIRKAGMTAANVWSGESTDRISERIVGNIFTHEIVVADISDLNANVMLELGLRLSSRKPTVVVAEIGGKIPFDIGDFQVLLYPADLNILGMERFFEELTAQLAAKHKAFKDDTYEPFLKKVIVDVLEPSSREVPLNDLILERLDDLAKRISRTEDKAPVLTGAQRVTHRHSRTESTAFFNVPADNAGPAMAILAEHYDRVRIIGQSKDRVYLAATPTSPRQSDEPEEVAANDALKSVKCFRGVPEPISDDFSW